MPGGHAGRATPKSVGDAIGENLRLAVGVALSPMAVIAVILMLSTPKGRSNGSAFAVGWVVGLVSASVIVLLVASDADDADSGSSTAVNWVKLLLGVLFLVMALGQWRKRPQPGVEAEKPRWMAAMNSITPGKSLAIGTFLSLVNPTDLALAAAASIAEAGLDGAGSIVATGLFVIIGSLTVDGPVVMYLLASQRAAGAGRNEGFLSAHNAVMVLGAKLIAEGAEPSVRLAISPTTAPPASSGGTSGPPPTTGYGTLGDVCVGVMRTHDTRNRRERCVVR